MARDFILACLKFQDVKEQLSAGSAQQASEIIANRAANFSKNIWPLGNKPAVEEMPPDDEKNVATPAAGVKIARGDR
jgi:hypothetical protein